MADIILKIPLTQHSPYIHFQYDQRGAALRASDLKPRIDKYLSNKPGYKPRYQLSITSSIIMGYPKEKSGKEPYWGKYKVCKYENIIIHLNTYFDKTLQTKLEAIIPEVLACENFGSFGSKGYGCFTPQNMTKTDFNELLKSKFNPKPVYYWTIDSGCNDEEVMFQIKTFYSLLKSGINIINPNNNKETYHKSLLMTYFKSNTSPIRWEKRGIKKNFGFTENQSKYHFLDDGNKIISNNERYKAIKPLFGYSKSQDWKRYTAKIGIEFPNGIERIPSPLFFKVFKESKGATIYFTLRNEELYKNKAFGTGLSYKFEFGSKSVNFDTPDTFDYENFLEYAIEIINKAKITNNKKGLAGEIDTFITNLTIGTL